MLDNVVLMEFIKAFVAIFVIMDVFGNVPIFSILNGKFTKERKIQNIKRAVLIASIVLFLFLFIGNYLLNFFGVRMSSFKVAGGIVLMILGLKILLGLKLTKKEDLSEIAVVPMATPLITGPGVITTVMILVGKYGYWIPLIASILNLLLAYFILRYSDRLLKVIGKQGSDVVSRIMGLIIVAIAVEFIRVGWAGL